MELTNIIWMFLLGVGVAVAIFYYNNRFLGNLVRKLIEIDAVSPETALTPKELGIKMSPALKYSLRPGSSFSETVIKTEDGRYYVAPDKVEMAKTKYRSKNASFFYILLTFFIILVFGLAFTYVFPNMLETYINSIADAFGLEG